MTKETRLKVLGKLLFWFGLATVAMGIGWLLFPLGEEGFLVDAFRWKPYNSPYERMILMIFLAMGICMMLGSRKPERHLIIVLFVILHGYLHGGIMLMDSLVQHHELTHLVGDVPMLIGMAIVFTIFMPWDDLKKSLRD
jgi:hypothetical protein